MRTLFAIALLWLMTAAHAATLPPSVDASTPPAVPLGEHMRMLTENGPALAIEDVRHLVGSARFVPVTSPVLGAGIGHPPLWVHFVVDNPGEQPLQRSLTIEPTWTDHLDVHVVHPTGGTTRWHAGDSLPGAPYLNDALGYVFPHRFLPGRSEVFIRAATTDPLVLDVRLMTAETAARTAHLEHYAYGFLYGFLASLIIYNLVLFIRLGRRNSLYYSLYLLSFIMLNICYTGRGLAWLWPDYPSIQRFILLVMMVLLAHSGLYFAREFLELDTRAPSLARGLRYASAAVLTTMLTLLIADAPEAAAWLAFITVGGFVFAMIPLGVFALHKGLSAASYFLLAAVVSMQGMGMTLFSVWGVLPYNVITYRGIELGMMLEATLLALALAEFVRSQLLERQRAERDAQLDTLTQLYNRRGFFSLAEASFRLAQRHARPLTVVMLDLDHFKVINDQYGHPVGDLVLADAARTLQQSRRRDDVVARWGGEEFVLFLPETTLEAAVHLAERLRGTMENRSVNAGASQVRYTASFGVAALGTEPTLEALIAAADQALYAAKQAGRNCVVRAEPGVVSPGSLPLCR